MLRKISIKIAEISHDHYGGVLRENAASLSLFLKHCFKMVDLVHLITTEITWTPADKSIISLGSQLIIIIN